MEPIPESPFISDSDRRALRRLVDNATPQDQLASLVETVVSNVKVVDLVKSLQGGDAQAFIDTVDEVCRHPREWIRC